MNSFGVFPFFPSPVQEPPENAESAVVTMSISSSDATATLGEIAEKSLLLCFELNVL